MPATALPYRLSEVIRQILICTALAAVLAIAACSQEVSTSQQTASDPVEPEASVQDEPVPEAGMAAAGGIDPDSGLVRSGDWQVVKAHCGACHSTRLITQNRGDRETWLSLIRWMQDSQGLWQFDQATEDGILDYLASNYAPPQAGRRPALDESLLPPNPYNE